LSNKSLAIQDLHTVIFDFDGVFTDNFVYVDDKGNESVRCSRADSYGISLLNQYIENADHLVDIFVLSTESNEVVRKRCEKMRIKCNTGVRNKDEYLIEWLLTNRTEFSNPFAGTLYFGNDLNDFEVMMKTGYSFAPIDAHPRIKEVATHVFSSKGGQGFVREGIEFILGLSA